MPNISITESETTKLASFDVTENSVLMPMLYVGDVSFVKDSEGYVTEQNSEGDEIFSVEFGDCPAAKAYSDVSEFTKAFNSNIVQLTSLSGSQADKTYTMGYTLIQNGLTVIIKPINYKPEFKVTRDSSSGEIVTPSATVSLTESEIEDLLRAALNDGALDEFANKNIWNIKFITTGGYANINTDEINSSTTQMSVAITNLAEARKDAVALLEFQRDIAADDEGNESDATVIANVGRYSSTSTYAAAFLPWGYHTGLATATYTLTAMPACFSYLMAYANSVKTNANWFAASGVIRGEIPTLKYPVYDVGESLMHILQGDTDTSSGSKLGVRVNPIMDAGTYGYRIWGNKVIYPTNSNLEFKFVDFLNVRLLLCDIKKQVYHACMRTMFEPNDDIAWFTFKHMSEDLLEQMKTGRGLLWYKWTKATDSAKGTLEATLTIRPIEAIENISIDITMTDETVTTEETVEGSDQV